MEENDRGGRMIYCKNLCKCHNILQYNNNKNKIKANLNVCFLGVFQSISSENIFVNLMCGALKFIAPTAPSHEIPAWIVVTFLL
jgi:hypothetical protein